MLKIMLAQSTKAYSRANGEAVVKAAKSLWTKSKDENKALLEYRITPIPEINLPPFQISMRCRHGLLAFWSPISKREGE